MPLLSFSDRNHVRRILLGIKDQTTRPPRKCPIKVDDTLYVYFRNRMVKGTCYNCISLSCPNSNIWVCPEKKVMLPSPGWSNYFGSAATNNVLQLRGHDTFADWDNESLHTWAVCDGFMNFDEADKWFTKVHGVNWMHKPWDIIQFKGDWVQA